MTPSRQRERTPAPRCFIYLLEDTRPPRPGSRPRRARRVPVIARSAEAARLGVIAAADERLRELPSKACLPLPGSSTSSQDTGAFYEALGSALASGAGLDEALELAAQGALSPRMRGVIGGLRLTIREGGVLADGMAREGGVFPARVVAMLRAAETAGGELGRMLLELAARGRQESRLRRKFVNALAYPAVVLLLTVGAAIVLQLRALPPMVENFKLLGATLPLPTRVLYDLSRLMLDHGLWLLAGMVGLTAALWKPAQALWQREGFQSLVLRMPLAGPILRAGCLVRALNTFALLKACGAPTGEQFRHAAEAAGNPVYRRFLLALHARVIEGEELHAACLAERDLLPGDEGLVLAAKLRIGAFSGDGAALLRNLADDLSEQADLKAGLLPQMIEVPLLLVCGSVIACIILAMLLPMPGLVIDMLKRPGGF